MKKFANLLLTAVLLAAAPMPEVASIEFPFAPVMCNGGTPNAHRKYR